MASSGMLPVNLGRGMRPPKLGSVWIARLATQIGGVYMLAEEAVTDDAAVTQENSGADNGTLANTVGISAGATTGLTATGGTGNLALFVLAEEAAAIGQPYMGMVEGYYVDATVTVGAAQVARLPLYATTGEVLSATLGGIGAPAIGRLLQPISGASTALRKVHFCGLPGGFGVGPGTT